MISYTNPKVPMGASSLQPGTLPRVTQRPGSTPADDKDHGHHAVLNALSGKAPRLVPTSQEGGNLQQEDLGKAAMTAPGSEPSTPLPGPFVPMELGPESEQPQLPVNTPEKPPEHAGIPDAVTKFGPAMFGPAGGDGGSGLWGRTRS